MKHARFLPALLVFLVALALPACSLTPIINLSGTGTSPADGSYNGATVALVASIAAAPVAFDICIEPESARASLEIGEESLNIVQLALNADKTQLLVNPHHGWTYRHLQPGCGKLRAGIQRSNRALISRTVPRTV
ncbi:MAG: hypothetical protein A2087_06125 [Spirochaetes bacterium GWD1_61_31]|nr:MAG: hypothetical protein A2087_06125 [Spirochaetes bacterium GWD1_61_31]OHD44697.1 MAG: hypothetical protein A2Y35_01105 [Spirochaetes bacterium GWE1_60_18]HAP43370.1 hypothetical protein [Spirochaetaceae bacterium]HAW86896.1 hypothetical protein [Spirochaetaceae bacterium]HAX37169.1 hypothetical protein [Spirochaetaceae bacterium]